MSKIAWFSSMIFLIFSFPILADIAPLEYPGTSLASTVESVIRMKREKVDIYIGDTALVTAEFVMENPTAQDVVMQVGFPIKNEIVELIGWEEQKEAIRDGYAFLACVDDQEIKDIAMKTMYGGIWFGWNCSFHPGETVVKVTYTIEPNYSYKKETLNVHYIFSTGAAWRDTIEDALLTVHFQSELDPEQIMPHTRPSNFKLSGKKVEWHFSNFEPSSVDDMQLEYLPMQIWKKIQVLRRTIDREPGMARTRLELARYYFKTILTNGLFSYDMLDEKEWKKIIERIQDPSDRQFFISSYILNPYGGTMHVLRDLGKEEKSTIIAEVLRILYSIGFEPEDRYGHFADDAERLLQEAVNIEPTNAETWNTYLAYYGFMHFGGMIFCGISSPDRICEENKKLILRAFQHCPRDEGIRLWREVLDDSLKHFPKKPGCWTTRRDMPEFFTLCLNDWTICNPQKMTIADLTIFQKYYNQKPLAFKHFMSSLTAEEKKDLPHFYRFHMKRKKLLPEERMELITLLRKYNCLNPYYENELQKICKKIGVLPKN